MASPPPKIRWAVFVILALLALAVRLPELGQRPMHTDESINAYIVGGVLAGQAFHYDPQDRHGPALAAFTVPLVRLEGAKTFSGLTEFQLRLSPVLAGTIMVLLFGAGVQLFGFASCLVAALLFAFAPLPVYYNRYFIHESLFVTATWGLIFSGWRAVLNKSCGYAALAGFCGALMLTSKETAPLHFLVLAVAALGCRLIQRHNNTTGDWPPKLIILTGFAVFLVTSVLLFTWFGERPGVFADLFHAVPSFAARAGGEGHEKPFWYYAKLLSNGWSGGAILALAMLGICSIFFTRWEGYSAEPANPAIGGGSGLMPPYRLWLVIYGIGTLATYSLIPYKTPWLALNFWPALALLSGIAVEKIWLVKSGFNLRPVDLASLVLLGSLVVHDTRQWVFLRPADENNPYAYAHTVEDLLGLPKRIEELSRQEKLAQPRIAVVAADAWPLPWYLRKYSQVGFWQPGQDPGPADFFITSPEAAEKMSDQLKHLRPEFFGLRPEVLMILWTPAPVGKPL